jgi:sec-independent protein translocase protein TatC
VVFELPLAMFLAGRGGILSAAFLRKWRKGALLGALVLAAVLTPPDAVSQILVSVPMYALFEAGILLCALGERRRGAASAVSPS